MKLSDKRLEGLDEASLDLHLIIWRAFVNGYACGMDHDQGEDMTDEAEAAFAEEYPGHHARCVEEWKA